jgi:excisionase family DNA binding protein
MPDPPTLLTVPETAAYLRISRNTAYEIVKRGELPSVRLGRVIRVPRASLDAWIVEAAQRALAGDEPAAWAQPLPRQAEHLRTIVIGV